VLIGYSLNTLGDSAIPIAIVLGLLMVLVVIFLAVVGNALGTVYKAALYRYATTSQVAPGFPSEVVQGAYRSR
jgi:hypothetical protein